MANKKEDRDRKSIFVNTIMTEEMHDFVCEQAAKNNVTKSEYIRSLIDKEMPKTGYDKFCDTLSFL